MTFSRLTFLCTGLAASIASFSAMAVTECRVTPGSFYVGGDPGGGGTNYLWVNYAEGGAGVIYGNDVNFKPALAMVITAKTTQRTITVRYAADGVNCTASNPGPILGLWLN